jgi:hypothetical protein
MSASSIAHIGPGPIPASSTTLIPASGPTRCSPSIGAPKLRCRRSPVKIIAAVPTGTFSPQPGTAGISSLRRAEPGPHRLAGRETEQRNPIGLQSAVVCAQDQAFEIGLGNEQAIERIGMVARKLGRCLGVLAGYRQQLKAVSGNCRPNRLGKHSFPIARLSAISQTEAALMTISLARIRNSLP